MAKTKKLSDSEVVSICRAEITNASGYTSGELSDRRSQAMDYYLGEPLGNEVEGRSQIRTRETLETVEWVLPSLIRLFTDSDNMVLFDPVGPEDVEQAKQETEMVNHVYWKENRGFYNTYAFFSLYANIDQFSHEGDQVALEGRPELDQWVIS